MCVATTYVTTHACMYTYVYMRSLVYWTCNANLFKGLPDIIDAVCIILSSCHCHCLVVISSSSELAVLLTALLTISLSVTSSMYLSTDRRRAFMKKLTTVETLRPSCSAIVAWISLLGRLISLKMATRVRL